MGIWSENGKLHFVKAKLAAWTHLGPLEPTFWVPKTPKNKKLINTTQTFNQGQHTILKKKKLEQKIKKTKKTKQKKHPVQPQNQKKIANCKKKCFDDAFETPFGL